MHQDVGALDEIPAEASGEGEGDIQVIGVRMNFTEKIAQHDGFAEGVSVDSAGDSVRRVSLI